MNTITTNTIITTTIGIYAGSGTRAMMMSCLSGTQFLVYERTRDALRVVVGDTTGGSSGGSGSRSGEIGAVLLD